jgi:Tfp pilus assembly protein PilV
MRGIVRRLSSDEGMTLVEIMVSAAIMFIILTGVLSLVVQTTMMSVQAKEKNVMTNSLNAYIEWVHSLPFDDVDLVDDGGILPEESSQTVGGYTVVIRPTITTVTGNTSVKNLQVDIAVTDARGVSSTHSTTVVVRDRSNFMTQGKRDPLTDPKAEFIGLTPPSGTVVWDSEWSGGPLYLDVSAEASEGRVIEIVRVSFNSILCEDASLPPLSALWEPRTETFTSTSALFAWNTNQFEPIEVEEGVFVDTRLFGDGMGTLKVWVVDDAGIDDTDERFLLLDNFAPATPGSIAAGVAKANSVPVVWDRAADGNLGADSYDLEWVRQGMTQTSVSDPAFGYWNPAGTYTWLNAAEHPNATLTYEAATAPFSRYAARVRAVSPRGLTSDWTEATFMSRPLVSGTYAVVEKSTGNPKYWKVTANLSVTPPAFPTTGTTTYAFYRGTEATPIQQGTSTTCTDIVQVDVNPSETNFPVRSYRVVVTHTPAGIGGGTQQTSVSNTVSTVYQASDGTYTFAEGTW